MSLPRWLEPLLDSEQMRETDAWAIETRGMPSLDLMERAGEGLARIVAQYGPAGRVAVVCGKGNNGGDGLVAARLLRQAGRDVRVLLVWPGQWLEGDAAEMLKRLPGPEPEPFDADALGAANVIVDAVLGTGLHGPAARAGRRGDRRDQRRQGARGGGRRPDRGRRVDRRGAGRRGAAAATATFHRAKPGLWVAPGKALRGRRARDRHRDPARRARASPTPG